MVDEVALSQKYKYTEIESYANIPTNKENPDREWSQLRPDLVAHATTEKNIERILENGLKPRQATFCKVWGEERIPLSVREEKRTGEILQCREEHVYFWDDLQEAIGQALGTVAYLKNGNPAIIIAKQNQSELEEDPEIKMITKDPAEPQALMAKGEVAKDKIACFCTLSNEVKPDTGKVMCRMQHKRDQCELDVESVDSLYENLTEPDQWICFCKKDALK